MHTTSRSTRLTSLSSLSISPYYFLLEIPNSLAFICDCFSSSLDIRTDLTVVIDHKNVIKSLKASYGERNSIRSKTKKIHLLLNNLYNKEQILFSDTIIIVIAIVIKQDALLGNIGEIMSCAIRIHDPSSFIKESRRVYNLTIVYYLLTVVNKPPSVNSNNVATAVSIK